MINNFSSRLIIAKGPRTILMVASLVFLALLLLLTANSKVAAEPTCLYSSRHFINYQFNSYSVSGNTINDVQVKVGRNNQLDLVINSCHSSNGTFLPVDGKTGNYGKKVNKDALSDATGQVIFGDNCYNSPPYFDFTTPSGYTFAKATVTGPGGYRNTVNSERDFNNVFGNLSYSDNGPSHIKFINTWGTNINGTYGYKISLYFKEKINWKLTPKSTPAERDAYPGDTKNFSHTVGYTGNYPTYKYRVLYSHFDKSTGKGSGIWNTAVNWKNGAGNSTENTSFEVPASYSKGDRYCQRIEVTLATGPGSGNKDSSPPACLTIVKSDQPDIYTFQPSGSLKLDDDENPTKATYNYCVSMVNANVSSQSTQIRATLYKNGSVLTNFGTAPNKWQSITVDRNPWCLNNQSYPVSGLNAGDTICIITTVQPSSNINPGSVDSPRQCDTMVNKPFFKVINGSVMTGCNNRGGILAGWFNNMRTPYKGASTELASIAGGQIIGFGSGQIPPSISPTKLAFASLAADRSIDNDSPKLGGNFGAVPCSPDASQATPTSDPGASFNISAVGDNFNRNGNTTITTSNIPNSAHKTVFIDGDVFIDGNITYSGSSNWSDSDSIPSLILRVKGNIYISSAVTQLDGIYIAKPTESSTGGSIYTCATAISTPSKDYNACNRQLVVNGIFIANKINLLRTYGSLRNDNPGEVFKLSPEIYLNGTTMDSSISTGSYRYDAITSLPPLL